MTTNNTYKKKRKKSKQLSWKTIILLPDGLPKLLKKQHVYHKSLSNKLVAIAQLTLTQGIYFSRNWLITVFYAENLH